MVHGLLLGVAARPLGVCERARLGGVCWSVAGRRAWGAEDLEPVSLGDRGEPRHVGVALHRRRQDALGGRLADLSLESLELHRREADQRPRSACLGVEGVRHALGAERERAGLQGQARVGDPEGHLALEDVEPLVLLGVDVPGRADALGHDDLDQAVLPGRVVAADLDRLQHPRAARTPRPRRWRARSRSVLAPG